MTADVNDCVDVDGHHHNWPPMSVATLAADCCCCCSPTPPRAKRHHESYQTPAIVLNTIVKINLIMVQKIELGISFKN